MFMAGNLFFQLKLRIEELEAENKDLKGRVTVDQHGEEEITVSTVQ